MNRRTALTVLFCIVFSFAATVQAADENQFFGITGYHTVAAYSFSPYSSKPSDEFGIKEVVPKEFQSRYQKWKAELFATEYGRSLWDKYANNKDFLLTIKVAASRKSGAGTDDFEWDNDGRLIAATVTLGKDLDKGFPDPVYYPVMNSLSSQSEVHSMSGDLLASTKMAHEIGHVSFTAQVNEQLFRNQNRLMESYYSIFLQNGFNTRDPRLVSLETELGARPLEIWEDREYWSEAGALRYLVQRIERESYYCAVLSKIRSNVNLYASRYEARFDVSTITPRPICSN